MCRFMCPKSNGVTNVFGFVLTYFVLCSPITLAWNGGAKFAQRSDYQHFVVKKKEYDEQGGLHVCKYKFLNS